MLNRYITTILKIQQKKRHIEYDVIVTLSPLLFIFFSFMYRFKFSVLFFPSTITAVIATAI